MFRKYIEVHNPSMDLHWQFFIQGEVPVYDSLVDAADLVCYRLYKGYNYSITIYNYIL